MNSPQKVEEKAAQVIGGGIRYIKGKVRYELIPTHLLEHAARVLEFGATKYSKHNWCAGMLYSVVIGSIKRHLAAFERGEDIDPESGFRHTGHLICNLLFLEHYLNMKGKSEAWERLDDRPREWFGQPTTYRELSQDVLDSLRALQQAEAENEDQQ